MEPTTPSTPTPTPTPSKDGVGPVVGIIVVIAIVALGALYFWAQQGDTNAMQSSETAQQATVDNDPVADELRTQSNSTNISDIEADFEATTTGDVDVNYDEL